ncbi:sigma-54-dependent Fis family transcriptional regulator [Clostridium sp. P21]|uniref:Sigma-54-dependent Fis family transcriptional regulator n=1 Tax=Clostridium muellerianum TaxID=2716538 RepID=A0A7Y0HQA1_9CLOT|nr:sigma-54-dependent Fis family transcriptional regulator [Clostridium muellerianum]NMM63558.1 sigma-54-dependent Fis family transcriptional regulator [Clostridium muellerianum]
MAKAWNEFIKNGNISYAVRTEIAKSWRRCMELNVDPMGGKGNSKYKLPLKIIIERNEELISVARPVMESLHSVVAGSGFAIILADKDGYIIDVIGDTDIMKMADELNFVKGELWSEKAVGTNAIGTALFLDKPMQTIGAEHFGIKQHIWTCSASPVHDEDGNIIGCINMSGKFSSAHIHTLGIVISAAESIQKQLALVISNKLMNITFNSICEGMIVLNEKLKTKRVNGRAVEILGVMDKDLKEMDIVQLMKTVNFNEIIKGNSISYNNIECDFHVKGKIVKCIINAVPMQVNKKVIGIVITFREIQDVHRLVSKVIGYNASYNFEDIITQNKKMKDVIKLGKKIAKTDSNILIQGQSGTGKELIAQSIHSYSDRKSGPFVAVNCASIPSELVESELFGYEKGSFTGASKEGHPGKFEIADGGTIFLDEIGELPLDIQSKLLRVLDNNKISRLGATYEKQLNIRVIGATNRNLKEEIKKKNFREDLYYRLNVMSIETIPLNERKEDIDILVKHFVEGLNVKREEFHKKVTENYINKLKEYNWPGNVRELRNVVERDYYLSDDNFILCCSDEEKIYINDEVKAHNEEHHIVPIQILERETIKNALEICKGNMAKTAKYLNISRSTLYRKIKKYNSN